MSAMLRFRCVSSADHGRMRNTDCKSLPPKTAQAEVQRARFVPLVLKELIILSIAALGYSQHAKPYCSGLRHSLPPESCVLSGYPCDAGAYQRALYVLRNVFGVYKDMLRLGPADRWASFQMVVVVLRLVSQLVLPAMAYHKLATCFLSQLHRLIPLGYLLAMSYVGVLPSPSGQWYIINQPALDFLSNILFPVNPIAECMYGAVNILLITAIWRRFGFIAANGTEVGPAGLASVVVTGNPTTPPAAYHLGMWLPFQLLLSAACTVATVLLERWRSHPAVPGTSGVAVEQPQDELFLECPGLAGEPCGETSNGGGAADAKSSGSDSVVRVFGHEPCLGMRKVASHHGSDAPFRTASYPTASEATYNAGLARQQQRKQQDTHRAPAGAMPEVGNNTAARGYPDGPGTPSTLSVTGRDGGLTSSAHGGGGGRVMTMDCSNRDGAAEIAKIESEATGVGQGVDGQGPPSRLNDSGREEEPAWQVTTDIEGLQRCDRGAHVQAARGSPSSGVVSAWRDSRHTEGVMLDLLGGRDPVTVLDEADESTGVGNGLRPLTTGNHGGEPRSNGSSGSADATRQDQQQQVQSSGQEGAYPVALDGAAAAAAGAATGVPSDAVSLASAGALTAISGPASRAEPDSSGRHDHEGGHRLLRSLSFQPPEPQDGDVRQGPQHVIPPAAALVQPRMSAGRHQLVDQGPSARLAGQQPDQIDQGRDQQQVRLIGVSEGGTCTAAVVAAVRQSRRPAYIPRVRIVTTHIKVQGAQPEQLQSGYSQRLEHVASAAGQRLLGVYVRAGCIELVLDSADWGDAKSNESDEPSFDPPLTQPSGRDSGPLPAPLQPRPAVQPPYRSAPNTPSQLQRRQMQQPAEFQSQLQPSSGQALPAPPQVAYEPLLASPGSMGSRGSAALAGMSAIPGAVAASRSSALMGHGWSVTGGGSRGSLQGGAAGPAGGGNGGNGGNGGTGMGADLDLGAVIRALRLNRADGSAESTNDLASELDLDMDYMGGGEMVASGLSSGGSGGDASSKEAPSSACTRRADSVLTGAAATGLAATSNPGMSAAHHGQQPYQHPQLEPRMPLQQVERAPPETIGQPQQQDVQPAVLGNVGSISRQALVLGGQRDPLAPGIVSLNPRVFVTAPAVGAGASAIAAVQCATDMPAPASQWAAGTQLVGQASEAYYSSFGDVPPVMRFSAVVRRVGGVPVAPLAGVHLGAFGSASALSAMAVGGTAAAPSAAEPEFTIRARGEYLRIRVSRLSPAAAAAAMSTGASLARQGSMPHHNGGADVGSGSGSGGVLSEILGSAEAVQDTSKDMDTGDGQRTSPSWVWHESYLLELLDAPQTPGLLLADLRGNSTGPSAPCAVPLVAMSDLAAAAELQAVVERWEGSASELDDLLLDLGTWLHHTVLPQVAPSPTGECLALPRLDSRLAALGRHLLSYAEVCGWEATAASLRANLAKYGIATDVCSNASGGDGDGGSPWASPPAAAADSPKAVVAAAELTAASTLVSEPAPNPVQQRERLLPSSKGSAAPQFSGEGFSTLRRRVLPRWLAQSVSEGAAPGAGVGESGALKEAQAQELREFEYACKSSQIWVMTVLDVVCLGALLYRGRSESLLAPSNVTTLIACCCGAATAAARLLLPYQRWLRVAEMFKVPRHVCYGITKSLIAFGGFRAPPGIAAYELGLPVFVFESIIVPWSCLMSIPTAIAVCAAKLPIYVSLWRLLAWTALWDEQSGRPCAVDELDCLRRVGLEPGQAAALVSMLPFRVRLLRGLVLCTLFVAVTAICHATIRWSYLRSKRVRSLAALFSPGRPSRFGTASAATVNDAVGVQVGPAAHLQVKGVKAD